MKALHVLIFVVPLAPASLEAGAYECSDDTCQYVTTDKTFKFEDFNNGPIATCDSDLTNCKVLKPEHFPCYHRMQAVMKAVNVYLNRQEKDGTYLLSPWKGVSYEMAEQWDATMKACVDPMQ